MLSGIIVSIWNSLRIDRRISRTLAFMSLAVLILKTSSVAKIASLFPTGNSLKAKQNKAYRAISKSFNHWELFRTLILIALSIKRGLTYIPVILDYTYLSREERLLVAAAPYKGRAIPIAFAFFDFPLKNRKRALEKEFIEKLRGLIPKELTLVLIMDREFCGKRFLKELAEIGGVEVVVRLRKNANVKVEKRKEVSLRFIRKSRTRCTYGDVEGCLFVEPGRDRVLIFSTLSNLGLAVRFYQERMNIEEMFRDLKTHFGLERIALRGKTSKRNLISVLFVAYVGLCYADWMDRSRRSHYLSFVSRLLVKIAFGTRVLSDFGLRRRCYYWSS